MPIDIPYLGDMVEEQRYRRFAMLMAWYYREPKRAQDAWRNLLSANYYAKYKYMTSEQVFDFTVAELTSKLERNLAIGRRA